jgi:nucleotide-binding universal stress UspA family protein
VSAATNLRFGPAEELSSSLTARILRMWCAPEVMLVVTNFADEEALLFHAIRQARQSSAKVLLAYVIQGRQSSSGTATTCRQTANTPSVNYAQQTLERMARQLRWVGISCEPVLLRGNPAEEVLTLAKARAVDRLLLSVQSQGFSRVRTLAEEISPWAGIPVCVVNERLSSGQKSDRTAGQITLALSLRSSCEIPLSFAGRMAQELDASLTVMHVIEDCNDDADTIDRTSSAILSRLASESLREAQLLCDLEIAIRVGNSADEILKFVNGTNHDFLIVGAPQSPCAASSEGVSIVHRIVREALCPVIMLGPSSLHTHTDETQAAAPVPF